MEKDNRDNRNDLDPHFFRNTSNNEDVRPNSWAEWFRYVVETLKSINEKIIDIEKDIVFIKLDNQKELFSIKEKTAKDLQEITKSITVLQQKFILINSIVAFMTSIVVSVIAKLILHGTN